MRGTYFKGAIILSVLFVITLLNPLDACAEVNDTIEDVVVMKCDPGRQPENYIYDVSPGHRDIPRFFIVARDGSFYIVQKYRGLRVLHYDKLGNYKRTVHIPIKPGIIYNVVEDRNGYLWVSTESRYSGGDFLIRVDLEQETGVIFGGSQVLYMKEYIGEQIFLSLEELMRPNNLQPTLDRSLFLKSSIYYMEAHYCPKQLFVT